MPLSLNKPKLDNLATEIWKSAERLRGKFKAYEYQNVVLPIIVIRRLECVLIKWREDKAAFPGSTGFSPQNVWRMRQFYRDHTDERFLAQFVRELTRQGKQAPKDENLSQLVREMVAAVPWGHHANPLARLSDPGTRLWHLQATARPRPRTSCWPSSGGLKRKPRRC